ncbi:MAG: hypothetical protein RR382_13915, partial [Tannerellaceae bacterium]
IKNSKGADVTRNYIITSGTGSLTVTKRTITIEAASSKRVYDGTPLKNSSYSLLTAGDGLATGQTLESVIVTGSRTLVGTVDNVPSEAVIKSKQNKDVQANYDIDYIKGTLEVTKASIPLTVTAPSAEKPYDGSPLTAVACTAGGNLGTGDKVVVNATGSITEVADNEQDNNRVGEVKVMHGTDDVTSNYAIQTVAGTLTINPRELTVKAKSATRPYNGTPLTEAGYEITVGSVVENQKLSVTVSGSQTVAGHSPNKASDAIIMAGQKPVTGNYAVSYVDGTLEVTKAGRGNSWIWRYSRCPCNRKSA